MSIFLGEEFKKRIKAQHFLFRIVLFMIAAHILFHLFHPLTAIQCEQCAKYQACGTSNPRTCKNKDEGPLALPIKCVEGCFCANDTVLHNDKCIDAHQCPCFANNKEYPLGSIVMTTDNRGCTQKW